MSPADTVVVSVLAICIAIVVLVVCITNKPANHALTTATAPSTSPPSLSSSSSSSSSLSTTTTATTNTTKTTSSSLTTTTATPPSPKRRPRRPLLPPPSSSLSATTATANDTPSPPTPLPLSPSAAGVGWAPSNPSSTVGSCPYNYSPINTSSAWMESAGSWAHPCYPPSDQAEAASSGAADASGTGRRGVRSPLPPHLDVNFAYMAEDAEAMCKEAADLADILRTKIVENNMYKSWAQARTFHGHTILPGPRNFTSQFTDKSQFTFALRKQISVALVFLEQNRYNDVPLCERASNIVRDYDRLRIALLQTLCKTQGIILALNSTDSASTWETGEMVFRSVMPESLRRITDVTHDQTVVPGDYVRNYRDYVTACDVKTILLSAAEMFHATDWSSSATGLQN